MNLDSLTPSQRLSVMRVTGPLLISAGAGSGKTFTLTQRIAYALLHPEASGVQDIDQICAITFTEKAAGEIKARVKSTLRKEDMADQALKVDGSWISTIHGMCSRMLRSHALEIGIDPGFGVIDEVKTADLLSESIDEVLGQDNEIISRDRFTQLFDEFPARSVFPSVASVSSMIHALLNEAANLRRGLDDISFGAELRSAQRVVRDLLEAYEDIAPILDQAGASNAAEIARVQVENAITRIQEFIQLRCVPSYEEAAKVVNSAYFIPCTFGNAEVKASVKEYQQRHAKVSQELLLCLARPRLEELMALSREVLARYEAKKKELFVFDNNDLLSKTLRAFEEHPEIALRYSEQFKLMMVDEFQDTSQMQIDIISYISGEHFKHLCTVGDSQQSIYRFRGADVNVYEAHKKRMDSSEVGALTVNLTENFRSHGDVLKFVDRIFAQDQVFGDSFMSLTANDQRKSKYKAALPRIDLLLAMRPPGNNTGVSTADAKRVEAQGIAQRFAAFREAGHDPSDMVVLLGKMTNAQIYAQALRDEGFECVITGGSLFDKAPEVAVVARLVEVLANKAHTAALFEVLTSEMFFLTADDLIQLATLTDADTGQIRRCDLHVGFEAMMRAVEEGNSEIPTRLFHAVAVLGRAWKSVGCGSVSSIVEQVLIDSGWMSRLESQGATGLAQAGNVLKALRMIERLEREHALGVAQLAQEFSAQLAHGLKEAPGALTGEEQGVIKIMTIHASKGLEFPLVALADFYGMRNAQDKLLIETCAQHTFASLSLGESAQKYPELQKRAKQFELELPSSGEAADVILSAQNLAEYREYLKRYAEREELFEARRKFYVGLTRASEALIVSMSAKSSSKDPLLAYKDILDDVRSALCGDADFPAEVATLEYGGSQEARFERVVVSSVEDEREEEKSNPKESELLIFEPLPPRSFEIQSYRPHREEVFSYSSLSSGAEGEADGDSQVPVSPQNQKEIESIRLAPDSEKATNLGTAFHRLAQYAIESKQIPSKEKVKQLAHVQDLNESQLLRLSQALDQWFSSDLYTSLSEYQLLRCEVPFFTAIDNEWLEGEIDLMATVDKSTPVLVVDYKTGGNDQEDAETLYAKHLLQAQCYAYAVLKEGYSQIDLVFVRVEQLDKESGDVQQVRYSFAQQDLKKLRRAILDKRQGF